MSNGNPDKVKNIKDSISKNKTLKGKDTLTIKSRKISPKTNELKQGEIIIKDNKGNIKSIENYKNDTLNGYFFKWKGMQKDGFYKMGKKDGLFRTYYGKKEDEKVLSVSLYKNDTLIWTAFPASDEKYICNPKGFQSDFDTIYIRVPRPDNTLWYEGLFINNKEVGKHLIYKKNGELYAIADYDKELIYYYNNDTISFKDECFKEIKNNTKCQQCVYLMRGEVVNRK